VDHARIRTNAGVEKAAVSIMPMAAGQPALPEENICLQDENRDENGA
jgi:hypothetical protein